MDKTRSLFKGGRFLIGILLVFVLLGCSRDDTTAEPVEPIEVELQVPEKGKVNEPIEISATVTQGDELVADADEVIFEIWKDGNKEECEMIGYDFHENGTYSIVTTFTDEGVFHVQVHVTARRMHVMPTKQITIGD